MHRQNQLTVIFHDNVGWLVVHTHNLGR